jgi:hypothetical protein
MRARGVTRATICTAAVFAAVLAITACDRGEGYDGEDGAEGSVLSNPIQPSPTPTPTPTPAPAPTPSPTPTPTPTPTPSAVLSYDQDLKPVFDMDCVRCHGGSRPSAGYNMTTYAGVMALVRPGDANSILVQATRSGGLMYGQFSGDRAAKADMVRRWVVDNNAAQSR